MHFLSPNQRCQSTEGKVTVSVITLKTYDFTNGLCWCPPNSVRRTGGKNLKQKRWRITVTRVCYLCVQCTVLCCKDCSVMIANIRDVFTVTVTETSGPLAIHVNPGGVVSELITVTAAAAVTLSSFPVLQDTWYPGYVSAILHRRWQYLFNGHFFRTTRLSQY